MKEAGCLDSFQKATGTLVMEKLDAKTRKVLQRWKYKNIVVNNSKTQMCYLLAGSDMTNRYISRMQFGVGSTAAAVTDTALANPITPIKTVTASFPTATSVQFLAELAVDEANGFTIQEAGLLYKAVSPALAARVVVASQTKSSDFIYRFRWTIQF